MGNKIIFMIKEFILLIAYRACSCKNSVWGKNPFQYESAIRLISILLFIHMSQIALLLIGGLIKSFSKTEYLVALVTLLFLPYLIRLIFSKKILAKSIAHYKESTIDKNAKLIAYPYLILNMSILLIIYYFKSSR